MKKILVKISGEYFGSDSSVFDQSNIVKIAKALISLRSETRDAIYVVVGGGNICRGRELKFFGFDHGGADHIGMLSTVQNALILKKVFDKLRVSSHVMAPFAAEMLQIHPYQAGKAKWWAEEQASIVIFGGGLGSCGYSTDMTTVSRAYEVGADLVIKVTEVGALFTSDPAKDSNALSIKKITAKEVIEKGLEVMDEVAFAFAKTNNVTIKITDLQNLKSRDFFDTSFGTIITPR
jgi:uridylate kinase